MTNLMKRQKIQLKCLHLAWDLIFYFLIPERYCEETFFQLFYIFVIYVVNEDNLDQGDACYA